MGHSLCLFLSCNTPSAQLRWRKQLLVVGSRFGVAGLPPPPPSPGSAVGAPWLDQGRRSGTVAWGPRPPCRRVRRCA